MSNIAVIQANMTCSLANKELFDLTPLPDNIPKVKEIGATSAPLMSAAFFIGARCRPFNDDYMKCKEDAEGRGELECMKEGRKVTRCAQSVYVNSSNRLQNAQGKLIMGIQTKGHKHTLSHTVPGSLAVLRKPQSSSLRLPKTRMGIEQMRLGEHGTKDCSRMQISG
jgi:hypothetical protein